MTLYLKTEQTAGMRLEILDSFGNLMFKADGYRTNESIKIASPWKAGVYIVRAFYGNEVDETKIIKLE